MSDYKTFPDAKLKWRRAFRVGTVEGKGAVDIDLSEPFEDGPDAWYCAVRITCPDRPIAAWIAAHDPLSALARGLHFIELQQRVLVRRYGDDLIWPLLDKPVCGNVLVDFGFEAPLDSA